MSNLKVKDVKEILSTLEYIETQSFKYMKVLESIFLLSGKLQRQIHSSLDKKKSKKIKSKK